LIRQRGTRHHPGKNVKRGTDDTLFSVISGVVKYHSGLKGRRFVSVFPAATQVSEAQ
jgi:large subunit ribosomal protein L27